MKKVSITVPVHNQEKLIVRALDSIPRRQDIEVVVCDDGSTDGTWNVLERYASDHSDLDIKLLRNETNMGECYTRNRLLDECQGQYVIGLDSDAELITARWEEALCHVTDEDIVYIDGIAKNGWYVGTNESSKWNLGAVWLRFVKRSFIGDTRFPDIGFGTDREWSRALDSKPHIEKFTHICAYRYNFPREGSICWNANHPKK